MIQIKKIIKGFDKDIAFLKKKYNKSKMYFYMDYISTLIFHRASPKDYLFYQMYKLNRLEKSNVVTYKRNNILDKKLNDFTKDISPIGSKSKFITENREYAKRLYLNSNENDTDKLLNFLQNNSPLVFKPDSACKGKGVEIINFDDYGKSLIIKNKNENIEFILESKIIQHNIMSKINPCSVNTIRVNTIQKNNGEVEIISATLRTAIAESVVDNMANGGIIFPLDIHTGIVNGVGLDYNYEQRYIFHPYTKFKVLGQQIPNWEYVIKSSKEVASKYKSFRWLGFDIAITEDGVEIIEANLSPDPRIMQASFDFKYKYLKGLI